MKRALALVALALAAPLAAQEAPTLDARVSAELGEAATGTRYGLVVADAEGREIVAVNPDQRFIPASNTKIVTTAAAWWSMPAIDQPDAIGGAAVRIEGRDLILTGRGDARLSSAPDCLTNCLAQLANAIAAGVRRVRNVTGDATLFPDERWSSGMSWNNIPTRSGTAIAALSLDDNELVVTVTPGKPGEPPRFDHLGYVGIDNRVVTVSGGKTELNYDRLPFARTMRVTGTIAADAAPQTLRFGIDDPAHYAAWRLAALLKERGVKVTGTVQSRYRPLLPSDDPEKRAAIPPRPPEPTWLAALIPPPLTEDVRTINKVSQNLHAELLLRRTGLIDGSGSVADGQRRVEALFAAAGVPRTAFDFSDGSGMSTYNRVAPRGMVTLLRWVAGQPWGGAWRETLPVGGVDGTLARRFKGTPLEGRIFAKTGSLNATSALAGYMLGRSGKLLTFAAYANDVPSGASGTPMMDAALVAIAEAN
ncbi:D-alanyl-D-alanine carboxypeptidase/D-alanyl-D-alanine-endopeptidase [Sphingomonas suaedae]|uniref:D-alanyl-D-alanine carboxypeptidase/D-alanyl-D-alanine-endopeptidase n=1 Tax=Sphingomonas suaedae TaxID=2599297 RepID=A0A518RG40_9SPHN|nr:D-alanyl-D-alanine carboxypeptidase/D-alanyl-D-alanine-endopeptidase [Sphingomonas suaedae]QDX26427.1 D-alanyl-D-alanine carboxypeptidase/D-alanyl-D-alanine-endopeptidase [Sphingomonas suaedae]